MRPGGHHLGFFLLGLLLFTAACTSSDAPETPRDGTGAPAGVPADSAALISDTFRLQDRYTSVRCASADDSCPGDVEAAVPSLGDGDSPSRSYEVTSTHRTIQEAVDASAPGELIVVTPGTYRGFMLEEGGGEDDAYLHVLGLGEPGDVVIEGTADPDAEWLRDNIYLLGDVHHIVLQNLTVADAERAGILFSGYFEETGNWAHHLVVLDVIARDNQLWGMHTTSASHVLVQDSTFVGSAEEHGLYLSGSGDDLFVRRNVFQGNTAAGVQVNADPTTAMDALYAYIAANGDEDVCGLESGGFWQADWDSDDLDSCYERQDLPDLQGRYEDGISERVVIEQNVITGNGEAGGAGINLASVRDSDIRNNLVYGNDAASLACWDDGFTDSTGLEPSPYGCRDVRIVNNTFVDPGGDRGSLILLNRAQDMKVFNNIIVRNRDDAYEINADSGEGLESANNLWTSQYVEGSPGFSGDTDSIEDIAYDEALAEFVNPGYEAWVRWDGKAFSLNPDRPDYHLKPGSRLLTSGREDVRPEVALDGAARSGASIGALESS